MRSANSSEGYATVRIPKELAYEIDKIVNSGAMGYRSRAEMVKDAIRLRIELLHYNNSIKPDKQT